MATLTSLDDILARSGYTWPVNLLLGGATYQHLYYEIIRKYPELSSDDVGTYIGGALAARRAASSTQEALAEAGEVVYNTPFNPNVPQGRFRYTISIEGTDKLTGLRAFPQFEIDSSTPLTAEQIDIAVGRRVSEWGSNYGVRFDLEELRYIIRSVEQG